MSTPGALDPTLTTVIADDSIITGFAADGIFTLVYNADLMTPVVGAQGDIVYIENADGSATLTLTLLPTSSSIELLRRLGKRRRQFPISISDASINARFSLSSQNCRVQKMPDLARSTTAATTTCTIFLPSVKES